MASTKTQRILLTSQSLAAGASVNTTEWNMSTAYAGSMLVRLTNGASAPTTAPLVKFFSGDATGKKYVRYQASGDTVNSSINDYECEYGLQHMFANCTITNGATNAITVEVYGQEGTSV
jgi:hypothetical protein